MPHALLASRRDYSLARMRRASSCKPEAPEAQRLFACSQPTIPQPNGCMASACHRPSVSVSDQIPSALVNAPRRWRLPPSAVSPSNSICFMAASGATPSVDVEEARRLIDREGFKIVDVRCGDQGARNEGLPCYYFHCVHLGQRARTINHTSPSLRLARSTSPLFPRNLQPRSLTGWVDITKGRGLAGV